MRKESITIASLFLAGCGGGSSADSAPGTPGSSASSLAPQASTPTQPSSAAGVNTATPSASNTQAQASIATPPNKPATIAPGKPADPPRVATQSAITYNVPTPEVVAYDPVRGDLIEAGAGRSVNRLEPDGTVIPVRGAVDASYATGIAALNGAIIVSSANPPYGAGLVESINPAGVSSTIVAGIDPLGGVAVDAAGLLWYANNSTGSGEGLWKNGALVLATPDLPPDGMHPFGTGMGPLGFTIVNDSPIWSQGASNANDKEATACVIHWNSVTIPACPNGGALAALPDGSIAYPFGAEIDRAQPDGTVSKIMDIPQGTVFAGLAYNPKDGLLWIADNANNRVFGISP